MPNIPQFDAQIQQIQVPSLRNFQEEQEQEIYKSVAEVSQRATNVAENLYAAQQMDLAERKGREFTKEDSIENLPTAYTNAQKAYNNAAISAYTVDVNTELTKSIERLAYENRENPTKFRSLAYADLNGKTKNAGIYTKKIQEPFVRKIESEYYSILSRVTEKNLASQKDLAYYQIYQRIQQLGKKQGADRRIDEALITADIEKLVSSGVFSADAAIKLGQQVASVEIGDRVTQYLATTDPEKRAILYSKLLTGNTGDPFVDKLTTSERLNSIAGYFEPLNKQAEFERTAGEKQLKFYTSVKIQELVNNNPEIMAANPTISYASGGYDNDLAKEMLSGVITSSLAEEKLTSDYSNGIIAKEDYVANLKSLSNNYKTNIDNQYVNKRINAILEDNKNITDSNGQILEENRKRDYIVNQVNEKLHERVYNNDEINDLFTQITKEANSIYNDKNTYNPRYSQLTFKNSFPSVNYEQLNNMYRADSEKAPKAHWFGGTLNVDISTPDGYENRKNRIIDYLQKQRYNNSEAQIITDHFLKAKKGELNGRNTNTNNR